MSRLRRARRRPEASTYPYRVDLIPPPLRALTTLSIWKTAVFHIAVFHIKGRVRAHNALINE